MIEKNRYEPGTFCWAELATIDSSGAKTFYGSLFGWAAEDQPAAPGMTYTMLRLQGKDVGALYELDKEQHTRGVPPHWNLYVSVSSADETAARVPPLGGKIVMAPFDVMDVGRMAIVQDPQGAILCLWQAKNHIGARIVNGVGAMCWHELATNDVGGAAKFYSSLLGWTTRSKADSAHAYTECFLGEAPVCGMLAIEKEWGPMPPVWGVYFQVADCDASVAKAKQIGAKVCVGPEDIRDVGRFAVLADPQGAMFSVIRLK